MQAREAWQEEAWRSKAAGPTSEQTEEQQMEEIGGDCDAGAA